MSRRVFSNKNQEIPKQKKRTLWAAFPVTTFCCHKTPQKLKASIEQSIYDTATVASKSLRISEGE